MSSVSDGFKKAHTQIRNSQEERDIFLGKATVLLPCGAKRSASLCLASTEGVNFASCLILCILLLLQTLFRYDFFEECPFVVLLLLLVIGTIVY